MAVLKTRNNGTITESAYWGKIRSALRKCFQYWKPMMVCLNDASRTYKGDNKRQKKEYVCASCRNWFKRTEVQIDHIVPVGSLRCFEDIEPFIKRLTEEDSKAYQVLCKNCHIDKTNKERKHNKNIMQRGE